MPDQTRLQTRRLRRPRRFAALVLSLALVANAAAVVPAALAAPKADKAFQQMTKQCSKPGHDRQCQRETEDLCASFGDQFPEVCGGEAPPI